MTKKIEKLREINAIINEKLIELETFMFVEKIYEAKETIPKERPQSELYN